MKVLSRRAHDKKMGDGGSRTTVGSAQAR
jgi:hypothetical protein